ncbi:MAG TPA: hypothetical protein VIG99_19075 [Myxococcaceae bacterium]
MSTRQVKLCLKDLYHQDVVEMIERETRQFAIWEILDPADPGFEIAYATLWDAFGPQGEMERQDAVLRFLRDDSYSPTPQGTYIRYLLLAARDAKGKLCGVRDATILLNPGYAHDLCVVYLSHIYILPEARGTVLSYWLRIAPVEIACEYMSELHRRGLIKLPNPDLPGKHFGMNINLTAETEYFAPGERQSWQRLLFYGRGGFDAVNPRHFPYMQPDFRDPEVIRATGNHPVPFMIMVRRMGRERQATMPIDEASALMRLLYDDFACHCAPEFLENSLQRVLDRLAERSTRKRFVELLPLPTGAKDIARLKRVFRHAIYQRYYQGASPIVDHYLKGPIHETLKKNPNYLDDELARIAHELEARPRSVYANRQKEHTWEGEPEPVPVGARDDEPTGEIPVPPPHRHAGG